MRITTASTSDTRFEQGDRKLGRGSGWSVEDPSRADPSRARQEAVGVPLQDV